MKAAGRKSTKKSAARSSKAKPRTAAQLRDLAPGKNPRGGASGKMEKAEK